MPDLLAGQNRLAQLFSVFPVDAAGPPSRSGTQKRTALCRRVRTVLRAIFSSFSVTFGERRIRKRNTVHTGTLPTSWKRPCPKPSFAIQADRLRLGLQGRQLPVAGPCSATPRPGLERYA